MEGTLCITAQYRIRLRPISSVLTNWTFAWVKWLFCKVTVHCVAVVMVGIWGEDVEVAVAYLKDTSLIFSCWNRGKSQQTCKKGQPLDRIWPMVGQTNSMESSWEAYSSSASQKNISCISQNPKVHYCVHKSPPLFQILSQISPVHALNLISLTSILSFNLCLGLPSGLLPSALPTKPMYALLLSPVHATRPTHLYLLDFSL